MQFMYSWLLYLHTRLATDHIVDIVRYWADTFGAVKYPCATGVGILLILHMTLWHALCPLKRLKVIS